MKYVFLGMGLLLLTGCGGSSDSSDVNDSPQLSGDTNSEAVKDTAVTVDGYKQITITPDADVQIALKSGESFVLSSNTGSTCQWPTILIHLRSFILTHPAA